MKTHIKTAILVLLAITLLAITGSALAEESDFEFNAETGKITFKTDKFSTYTLSVKGGAAKKDSGKSPLTGQTAWPMAMFVTALAAAGIGFKKIYG